MSGMRQVRIIAPPQPVPTRRRQRPASTAMLAPFIARAVTVRRGGSSPNSSSCSLVRWVRSGAELCSKVRPVSMRSARSASVVASSVASRRQPLPGPRSNSRRCVAVLTSTDITC